VEFFWDCFIGKDGIKMDQGKTAAIEEWAQYQERSKDVSAIPGPCQFFIDDSWRGFFPKLQHP